MKPIFCTVVIPFRNEEKNLEILLPILSKAINEIKYNFEVILVDDLSFDNGVQVCELNANKFDNFKLLRLKERGGQSGAFKKGFQEAKGEYLIRMDADLQDNPMDLRLFVEKFEEGCDLVMGLRECRKHRRLFRVASLLYDLLIIIIFDTPLHSNSGSFVGFKTNLIKNIPWRKNDHRYLPLIAIKRGAQKIGEVIVRHNKRSFGYSKYNPLKKLIFGMPEVISFIFRLVNGKYNIKLK